MNKNRRRWQPWALLGVILLGTGCGSQAKPDLDLLRGAWKVESATLNGNDQPEYVRAGYYLFDGTKALEVIDQRVNPRTVELEPSALPKRFALLRPGYNDPNVGIYRVDGDQLTLCLADWGKPHPTEFTSPPGSNNALIVLRRLKP